MFQSEHAIEGIAADHQPSGDATVAQSGEAREARPLNVLAPLIKEEIEAGEAAGLEHYRAAGEMLLEAKSQFKHGEWVRWFDKQGFRWTIQTARRYMLLAEEMGKGKAFSFLTITEAIGPVAKPRIAEPAYHRPVIQVLRAVDAEALAREEQSKRKERELVRELGLQLIKIGYRVLAAKLHPDKPGGSNEAMARLNKVKSILEGALECMGQC